MTEYELESRRKRIATAIAADVLRGIHGQASRAILLVNGQHDSAWTNDSLVQKIQMTLRELDVK